MDFLNIEKIADKHPAALTIIINAVNIALMLTGGLIVTIIQNLYG